MSSQRLPIWLLSFVAGVYLFLHAPLVVLFAFSFNKSKIGNEWTGFTLHWYERLLPTDSPTATGTRLVEGLWASLLVGGASTVISTILGTLLAMALVRHKFRGRRLVEALLYIPIVTPEIVVGISVLILLVMVGLQPGMMTIIIAHVAFNVSFVAVVVHARLQGLDGNLEEAAMILGADELTAFWRVTVPQMLPGIVAGAMLAFTMSFDDYVITSFVAGRVETLPMVVYTMAKKTIEPSVNAMSAIILVVTTLLIIVAERASRDKPLAK